MDLILMASPDKLSLGAFCRFFRKTFGRDYMFGEAHYLMSLESIENYINDFTSKFPKGLITYYVKTKNTSDQLTCIPTVLSGRVDVIGWFDQYALDLKILKDRHGKFPMVQDAWKLTVEGLNKQGGR